MTPVLVQRTAMAYVGLQTRTTNALEMDSSTARIGKLWEQAYATNVFDTIPQRLDDATPMAVYTDYDNDHHGEYTLLVGAGVAGIDQIPEGLHALVIPSGQYLTFTATGSMPQAVIDVWGEVWRYFDNETPYTRLYMCDVEHYVAADTVTVSIAVAKK